MTWTSRYFSRAELTASDTATRRGIKNDPPADVLAKLQDTAERMDHVREVLGKPIIVSSGYRSPALNKVIGGSNTSHHTLGYAVDFTCPGFGTPLDVARHIRDAGIRFDQLIYEFGSWVHISFAPQMRRQLLTAKKINGKTVYEVGLNA